MGDAARGPYQVSRKAMVFVKVMGRQMVELADAEIAKLDASRRRRTSDN
jgi:hypothetical protein